ncbi:hypothetical protein CC86DRAFT_161647 [Ophiobolus disseminans]|uniref:F-box domain-containing protein n=1 Tax=Ophiobolus disseminans TaxID=1469910 RepID=A0A6A7AB42_9PLEO|nr:hypothetical protein CC86DRAFT_161647 [Ophiobolus disseminans]
MTESEIMTAIGPDFQFDEERPSLAKGKKSFIKKLSERREAFRFNMRGIQTNNLDQDEQHESSRPASSPSTQKDFFKLPPVNWSKSERSRNDFAVRYDDVANSQLPTPMLSPSSTQCEFEPRQPSIAQMDRQMIRDFVSSEATSTQRVHSSHSLPSIDSPCPSPLYSPKSFRVKHRSRSLPSQMTDEEMDAWLEKPEDADAHRQRKLSSAASSRRGSAATRTTTSGVKEAHRKHSIPRKQISSPRASPSNLAIVEAAKEEPEASHASEDAELPPPQVASTELNQNGITFFSLPDEVLLEITRRLDMKSVALCRASSKKIYDTVPAPLRPLVLKKT